MHHKTALLIFSTLTVLPLLPAQEQEARPKLAEPPGLAEIKAAELKGFASFLAADELGGRLTGSEGQRRAALYIAKHFQALGLEPYGDEDAQGKRSFYQEYPISLRGLDQGTEVRVGKGEQAQVYKDGFAVIEARNSKVKEDIAGSFTYAGTIKGSRLSGGVELEDWSDAIPVLRVEALGAGRKLGIQQAMGFSFATLQAVRRYSSRFVRQGARCMVLAIEQQDSPLTDVLTYMAIAPGQDAVNHGRGSQMAMLGNMIRDSVPMVVLSPKIAGKLMRRLGADADTRKAAPGEIRLRIREDKDAKANNVVAILRGSDPAVADEAVIYSAHMDHVGRRLDGQVFNGADDNASGTSGLMGIAKAFAKGGKAPRRTVIFLAVSGEELGLWGSAWYARHPTWPVDKLIANINTDMIGRSGPESGEKEITVTPSHRHRKFSTIVQDAGRIAAQMGLSFRSGDKYYTRSDHYNFARKGIPVVFFCNGEHADYHQVSDTVDKLDAEKMQGIARLAYWTGYLVAQADAIPQELGRQPDWLPEGEGEGRRDKDK